jgi:hypothetical protein
MRKFLIPAALIVSLAGGSAALAATKPAPAPAAATKAAASPKAADCAKQWKAQKKHTQTRKAFLAACEKA